MKNSAGKSGHGYTRVMLKLSGEVLAGESDGGIAQSALALFCKEIAALSPSVQFVIVVGGGNFWRFKDQKELGLERTVSDNMGMLATVMNALALQSSFASLGVSSTAFSAISMPRVIEDYTVRAAHFALESGHIVISAGGTGNPFFSTDSAAALRALELECDVLLKATNVDYVYDKDPREFPDAQKYESVSFQEVLEKGLQVMDLTAISLCRDNKLPIRVFNMETSGNLAKVVAGEKIGTLIC
jgi:uridylate kinase